MSGTPYTAEGPPVGPGQVSTGIEVGNAGGIVVDGGGIASDTILLDYGPNTLEAPLVTVYSGGTLVDTTIEVGQVNVSGVVFVPNPPPGSAFAFNTTIDGPSGTISHTPDGFEQLNAGLYLVSGGIASGGSVLFGHVSGYGDGTLISGFTVTSGGIAEIHGAVASGIVLSADAVELVQAGGSSFGTQVSGGATQIVAGFPGGGGVASGTTVHSGGVQDVGLVRADGFGTAIFDGTATSAVIEQGGTQTVALMGLASETVVYGGGDVFVYSAGITSNQTLSGGAETVFSSGVASGTTIGSGGFQTVSSGGSAVADIVLSSGSELIEGGGFASATEIGSGGVQTNSGITSGIAVDAGGTANDDGIANAGVINFGGVENIYGAASATDVLNGGVLFVSGTASGTFVNAGGSEVVAGTASGTTISGGAGTILANAKALAPTIDSGGKEQVASGGLVASATVSGGTLELAGGALVSGAITFSGTGAALVLDTSATPSNVISGFGARDVIDFKSIPFAAATPVVAGDTVTVTLGADVETLQIAGAGADRFSVTSAADGSAELSAACFRAGTRLAGEAGEVRVEAIRAGDRLVTAGGRVAKVVWVGHREVRCDRHPRPWDIWPVRVAAGAFGPGRPRADLFLSPDHAVFMDGALIPIRYLMNGRTIRQEPCSKVTYWHVELDCHDTLLAEGLPCESYLDTGNRGAFANGGRVVARTPDFALRVWDAEACAPLVRDGAALVAAKRHLLRRAAELGHAMTNDPALKAVLSDGRELPLHAEGALRRARLPAGTATLRLASRAWVPMYTRPEEGDARLLGVAISDLRLDGRAASLESAGFASGWLAPEPGWRWTNGNAMLDATAIATSSSEWR